MDIENIRQKFPFFRDSDKIYLDNASTTQKPDEVIKAVNGYILEASNVGRGEYSLSFNNSEKVDTSREKIAKFIGADKKEIVFTSGATASLNMIPEVWGEYNLEDGDEILVSAESHKSAKLPWYSLKERLSKKGVGIEVKEYRLRTDRQPNYGDIRQKVNENTRLISLTHIHNSYGSKTDVEKVKTLVNERTLISLDVCQSISHSQIDVRKLEVDFLSFSGHKMFANTGIGVLFIDESIHELIRPQRKGGGKKKGMPHSLEPGTPNVSGIISIGAAADFLRSVGLSEIQNRMRRLSKKLYKNLRDINGITMFSPSDVEGPVSFRAKDLNSKEIGVYLDAQDIFVRTGKHCSADQETVRVSPHFYNTDDEVEELVNTLRKVL